MQSRLSSSVGGRRAFTIVEMLVVIGTILIVMALLIPVLSKSREQAKMSRWESYMRTQRVSAKMVLQYLLIEDASTPTLTNSAQGVGVDHYERDRYTAHLRGDWRWGDGRWFGKKALQLSGDGTFAATDSRVDTVDPETKEYTIVLWVRPRATTSQALYSNYRVANPAVTLELDAANRLQTRIGATYHVTTLDELQVPENAWSMVAMVQQPNLGITIYRFGQDGSRGVERVTGAAELHPANVWPETVGTIIGAQSNDGVATSMAFEGDLDEVVVYHRVLTEDELVESFRMGRP